MRYSFRLLCVGALAVMPVFGCDFFPDPDEDGDCGCDDGNECTLDLCVGDGCETEPVEDGMECALNGTSGVCVSGECAVNLCEGVVCDDGNECTEGTCDYADGSCTFPPVGDGKPCGAGGYCQGGMCEVLVDQCTETDLAAIEAGDEPDPTVLMECTSLAQPGFQPGNLLACLNDLTECLEDAGTGLTAQCSSCFALLGCCVIGECPTPCSAAPPEPGNACDVCIQESCQPQVDVCVGGQ